MQKKYYRLSHGDIKINVVKKIKMIYFYTLKPSLTCILCQEDFVKNKLTSQMQKKSVWHYCFKVI